jgi:hypothetical protein
MAITFRAFEDTTSDQIVPEFVSDDDLHESLLRLCLGPVECALVVGARLRLIWLTGVTASFCAVWKFTISFSRSFIKKPICDNPLGSLGIVSAKRGRALAPHLVGKVL